MQDVKLGEKAAGAGGSLEGTEQRGGSRGGSQFNLGQWMCDPEQVTSSLGLRFLPHWQIQL